MNRKDQRLFKKIMKNKDKLKKHLGKSGKTMSELAKAKRSDKSTLTIEKDDN